MKNKQIHRSALSFGFAECSYRLMLNAVNRDYRRCRKTRGRNYKFGPATMLEIFATRIRYNDPFSRIAQDFGVSKSTAYRIFRRVLLIAIGIKEFALVPISGIKLGGYLVDATVFKVTRPKDNAEQKRFYSGKHKFHCEKAQIITEKCSMLPIAVSFTRYGSIHGYKLFKRISKNLQKGVHFLADSGYQGIQNLFPDSTTPKKKPRGGKLDDEDKAANKELSQKRILVEHANAYIKRYKILSETYRGSRDRLECIVKLITGIARYEMLQKRDHFILVITICGTTLIITIL